MGQSVEADGRSILHKGHGMSHTCAVPDVCKTPSPGGPVPLPYVNVAMDSDLTDGAETVQIEGNPAATVNAKISTSSGDEAGSVGGIISSKFKGTMTWTMGSLDVKAEGAGVVRFLDTAFHNGNTFNVAFKNLGKTGVAYADDFDGKCPICNKGPKDHRIFETENSAEKCKDIVKNLKDKFAAGERERISRSFDNGETWLGYMVGVMICGVCGKSFAAMSGDHLDGFDGAAAGVVDEVISGGKASVEQMAAANSLSATPDGLGKVTAAFRSQMQNIGRKSSGGQKGFSPPGNCAAAKLVAKKGHKPAQMTEMWFGPKGEAFDKQYQWRQRNIGGALSEYSKRHQLRILQNQQSRTSPSPPPEAGKAVASCHTCQDLLFLGMCPERTCGGG
jgi:hypothetical protein